MTLPTFLGIGVPRAGTTWLHTLLSGHAAVYLPTKRKEIRFFDRHYERGLAWYESFFCPPEEADRYDAIGEISPQYFYCEECPSRIAAALPDVKLLVMLRHPVDRAYSNYGFVVQRRNYRDSFERFLATRPNAVEMGFYSRHLARYLDAFGADRVHALVFEQTVADGEGVRRTLGGFLAVHPEGFPGSVGKVNASTVPKHGTYAAPQPPRDGGGHRRAARRPAPDRQGEGAAEARPRAEAGAEPPVRGRLRRARAAHGPRPQRLAIVRRSTG